MSDERMSAFRSAYERLAMEEEEEVELLPDDCTTSELVVASFKLVMERLDSLGRQMSWLERLVRGGGRTVDAPASSSGAERHEGSTPSPRKPRRAR